MTHVPNPEKREIRPPVAVIGTCEDGHETILTMAPLIAQGSSITGEHCLKPALSGSGACGKYLKVIRVFGK